MQQESKGDRDKALVYKNTFAANIHNTSGMHSIELPKNTTQFASTVHTTFAVVDEKLFDLEKKQEVLNSKRVLHAVCGVAHVMVVTEDLQVFVMGENSYGQLGSGVLRNQFIPVPVKLESWSKVKQIAAGDSHSIILLQDGELYGCGLGTCCASSSNYVSIPLLISTLHPVKQIACSSFDTIFTSSEGKVFILGSQINCSLHSFIASNSIDPCEISMLPQNHDVTICATSSTLFAISCGRLIACGSGLFNEINKQATSWVQLWDDIGSTTCIWNALCYGLCEKPSANAIEIQHRIYFKYKNDRLFFVSSSNSTDSAFIDGNLYTSNNEKISCSMRHISKEEYSDVLQFFEQYEERIGSCSYPDHVVTVYGVVEHFDKFVIVTESISYTLDKLLHDVNYKEARLSLQLTDRERMSESILKSVLLLREIGFTTRSITPLCFVSTSYNLKFMGFDKLISEKQNAIVIQTNVENIRYLAPEVVANEEPLSFDQCCAADLYSTGTLVCEMLIGVEPFSSYSTLDLSLQRKSNSVVEPYENYTVSACNIVHNQLMKSDSVLRSFEYLDTMEDALFISAIDWIYGKQNFSLGVALLKDSVKRNNVFACHLIVHLHRKGEIVEKSWQLARMYAEQRDAIKFSSSNIFLWLKRHATTEDLHLLLAMAYSEGWGCKQNYEQCYIICTTYPSSHIAQWYMGICYKNGEGVIKDINKAFYWYNLSANQGLASAQNSLGVCYNNGEGVEKDYNQAVHWYKLSANQGLASAQFNLGICYNNGEGVEKDYNQAVHWYKLSANQGFTSAQCNLGVCYKNGEGVEKDYNQAVHWYTLAANKGHASAQYYIGACFQKGEGVVPNFAQAEYWYKLAANQNYQLAQHALGLMYFNDLPETSIDSKAQAVHYFTLAAKQGNIASQNSLGQCYYDGIGVAQDFVKAAYWFHLAAQTEQGSATPNLQIASQSYQPAKNYLAQLFQASDKDEDKNLMTTTAHSEHEFQVDLFASLLETKSVGKALTYLKITDSTMNDASKAIQDSAPSGTLILAEKQTRGQGRTNRNWSGELKGNLYFTFIFQCDPSVLWKMNLVTPIAVCKALQQVGIEYPRIKWPNDVWVGMKKICGMLINSVVFSSTNAWASVGVGINVQEDMTKHEDEDVTKTATSCFCVLG